MTVSFFIIINLISIWLLDHDTDIIFKFQVNINYITNRNLY